MPTDRLTDEELDTIDPTDFPPVTRLIAQAREANALRARIAELEAALAEALDALGETLWQAASVVWRGKRRYSHDFTSSYEDALALLVKAGRATYVPGHECYADPVDAAKEAEKGACQ